MLKSDKKSRLLKFYPTKSIENKICSILNQKTNDLSTRSKTFQPVLKIITSPVKIRSSFTILTEVFINRDCWPSANRMLLLLIVVSRRPIVFQPLCISSKECVTEKILDGIFWRWIFSIRSVCGK